MLAIVLPLVAVAVQTCIGLIFVSGAVAKMRDWPEFRGILAQYALLPAALVMPVSRIIPAAELLLGIGLLLTGHVLVALAAGVLLLVYGGAMGINLARGHSQIDCGCFHGGTGGQRLSWLMVARNALLATLVLLCVGGHTPAASLVGLQGALAGLVLFVFYSALSSLWAIQPYWKRNGRKREAH